MANEDRRRNRSVQEMSAMGFTDMQTCADEDGWPYPDDDDEITTEHYIDGYGKWRNADLSPSSHKHVWR